MQVNIQNIDIIDMNHLKMNQISELINPGGVDMPLNK